MNKRFVVAQYSAPGVAVLAFKPVIPVRKAYKEHMK